jgi:hypothetical protein
MDDALAELRALRERLARLEQLARAGSTQPPAGDKPMDLNTAVGGQLNAKPSSDRERARLESLAAHFLPDPQMEASIAARAKDPATYDREMRRVGASDGLGQALYGRERDAAIKLGTFVPEKEGSK